MAKFKIGEKARFVGPLRNTLLAGVLAVGDEVVITEDLQEADGPAPCERQMVYVIDRTYMGSRIGCPPEALEKLLPKHQPDDLRVAEPHFINHQLLRWLKQEKKTSEHSKA
jgi:hypothetical protein